VELNLYEGRSPEDIGRFESNTSPPPQAPGITADGWETNHRRRPEAPHRTSCSVSQNLLKRHLRRRRSMPNPIRGRCRGEHGGCSFGARGLGSRYAPVSILPAAVLNQRQSSNEIGQSIGDAYPYSGSFLWPRALYSRDGSLRCWVYTCPRSSPPVAEFGVDLELRRARIRVVNIAVRETTSFPRRSPNSRRIFRC